MPTLPQSRGFIDSPMGQLLALLVVCGVVYWLWLGTPGFAASEGHRVVPGWTMLDTGNWLRLEMFGLTYIRKPPGMPWAIAAFGWVFGQSEWSARAVSATCATLAAIVCWLYSRRWFGPRAGFAAGIAQALTPIFWLPGGPGRTAEIEMLLIFGTQLAALGLVHLSVGQVFGLGSPIEASLRQPDVHDSTYRDTVLRCVRVAAIMLAIALGCVIAGLAKGVAALPVLAGVLLAVAMNARSIRPLLRGRVLFPVVVGCVTAAAVVLWIFRYNDEPDAVRETGEFLWTSPLRTLSAAPVAWISALPTSLAWLFVWGRDARQEAVSARAASVDADADAVDRFARAYAVARTLGVAWLLAAGIYTLSGVSNPRYLLPASILMPPIVGYVWLGVFGSGQLNRDAVGAAFTSQRQRIARLMLIGRRPAWAVLLMLGAVVSASIFTYREQAHAGQRAAAELVTATPASDSTVVFVDGLLEARPDVLLYAQRLSRERATESGTPPTRYVWSKPLPSPREWRQIARERAAAHPSTVDHSLARFACWIVRTDKAGDERFVIPGGVESVRASVGQFEFSLVASATATAEPARDESDFFR